MAVKKLITGQLMENRMRVSIDSSQPKPIISCFHAKYNYEK